MTGLVLIVLCGLIFLSVLVTILTIEILTKRQSVEDKSDNQTDIKAITTPAPLVENKSSTLKVNISSGDSEDSTTELQIQGDPTTDPVTVHTELQVENLTEFSTPRTVDYEEDEENEENFEDKDYQLDALNNYDIQSSLEDYQYDYSYPSSLVSSYS